MFIIEKHNLNLSLLLLRRNKLLLSVAFQLILFTHNLDDK